MTYDWLVLVRFFEYPALPVPYENEADAVRYAELISEQSHVRSAEVFRLAGVYKRES